MVDSETVVAEASVAVGYTSTGYTPADYSDPNATVVSSGAPCALETAVASSAITEHAGSNLSEGNVYSAVSSSAVEESHDTLANASLPTESTAALESIHMSSSKPADYDSTSNGNAVTESENVALFENGNATDNGIGASAGPEFVDGSVPAMSAEEERLWSIVRANSLDFNAWTSLIEETEKLSEDTISKIRKVYDAFLAEFPLCYGYWKKYTDHEARVGAMDKVVEVYERAVQGVTYSVDIWLHYCIFAINTYGDPDTIRRLFERALAYVGTDYLSYPLWDKYIEYEYMHQEWGRLAMIYTRILENPIQNLDRFFSSFKELAEGRSLSELRSAEDAASAAISSLSEPDSGAYEGVNHDAKEQSPKPLTDVSTEPVELEKYISIREEMYKKAKELESRIINFEAAIRRPYFHVRPLNVAELENWHNYLDYIEREGDLNKVVKLYERCVIACANYTEYWIRYILCMESSGSMDLADNALARATQVFVKRQPEIHLFAARFKEQSGDVDGARAAYQLVHTEISPGLLEAIIKHSNMEHRLGNPEDAFSLYEQAIAIERGKEHSQTLPMLFAQYSRFSYLVTGNAEKARTILVEALDNVQPSKPLLEALIHFETIQSPPRQISHIESLVDKFIMPNSDSLNVASAVEREELSSIFLEFLGLFGDVQSIKKAEDRHAKLFLPHRSMTEFKKRHAEDFLASDKSKIARSYTGAPSPAQWAGGYGVQPQTWPPTTQAQTQQWTPGYGQQAAYTATAYSGYPTTYPAPQGPTPVPQTVTAAYGAYPSTYPVQASYPQQSYAAQPAAAVAGAATLTPTQQPAPAPQAYYGSYY